MLRNDVLGQLRAYRSRFVEEMAYRQKSIAYIETHPDCFLRESPIHLTGSAWVMNQDYSKVLLMHHKKLEQWFQPGGHADGNHDLVDVALTEITEETGLPRERVHLVSEFLFDLDMHDIPTMNGLLEHGHIDLRYLVQIDDAIPVPGNHESHDIRWVPLDQVLGYNNFRSTYRMLEKTRHLRRHF